MKTYQKYLADKYGTIDTCELGVIDVLAHKGFTITVTRKTFEKVFITMERDNYSYPTYIRKVVGLKKYDAFANTLEKAFASAKRMYEATREN